MRNIHPRLVTIFPIINKPHTQPEPEPHTHTHRVRAVHLPSFPGAPGCFQTSLRKKRIERTKVRPSSQRFRVPSKFYQRPLILKTCRCIINLACFDMKLWVVLLLFLVQKLYTNNVVVVLVCLSLEPV